MSLAWKSSMRRNSGKCRLEPRGQNSENARLYTVGSGEPWRLFIRINRVIGFLGRIMW